MFINKVVILSQQHSEIPCINVHVYQEFYFIVFIPLLQRRRGNYDGTCSYPSSIKDVWGFTVPQMNLDNKFISDVNQINLFPMPNQGYITFKDVPFTHLMHCDITFFMPIW